MAYQSAVEFSTDKRVHISLPVGDLAESIRFYENLLGAPADKRRDDYARFSVAEPPLNLSLITANDQTRFGGHFGVQVKSSDDVDAMIERLRVAKVDVSTEVQQACCYAVQNKLWVADPDGNKWEVFVTTDDNAKRDQDESEPCCVGSACC